MGILSVPSRARGVVLSALLLLLLTGGTVQAHVEEGSAPGHEPSAAGHQKAGPDAPGHEAPGGHGAAGHPAAAPQPQEGGVRVGLDEHLGAKLPLDLPFRDETGRQVRLRDRSPAPPSCSPSTTAVPTSATTCREG